MNGAFDLEPVAFERPEGVQIICGQGHFHVLSVEEIYRAVAVGAPSSAFGLAFSEASGDCLVRSAGNSKELVECAVNNLLRIGCGHHFIIAMKDAFPIQVLRNIRDLPTTVGVFCATGNPATAIVAKLQSGAAVLGVIDGRKPSGVETDEQAAERQALIRRLGYLERKR